MSEVVQLHPTPPDNADLLARIERAEVEIRKLRQDVRWIVLMLPADDKKAGARATRARVFFAVVLFAALAATLFACMLARSLF